MRQAIGWGVARICCLGLMALWWAAPTLAVHENTNTLVFAPGPDGRQSASGTGTIDYRGGDESESRWTATFQFVGLEPNVPYVVAVQGRFGADGSDEAAAFSQICAFTADDSGAGGCWYYFVELIRLSVVQVRRDGLDGEVAIQATRGPEGPGSIEGEPNRFSPAELAGTPVATPRATPDAPATPA